MRVGFWRNHLLLLAVLVLVAKLGHFHRWGGFQEKSTSKKNMNSTLEFFIENYNNVSNDTYLFRVDKLLQSHMQVCASVSPDVGILAYPDMQIYGGASTEYQTIFSSSWKWLHLEWARSRVVQNLALATLPKWTGMNPSLSVLV